MKTVRLARLPRGSFRQAAENGKRSEQEDKLERRRVALLIEITELDNQRAELEVEITELDGLSI